MMKCFFPNNTFNRQVSFTVQVLDHMVWYLNHKSDCLIIRQNSRCGLLQKMLENRPEDALVKLVKTVEIVKTVETVETVKAVEMWRLWRL